MTLEELKAKKEKFEELSDLPIEDFVDWDGLLRIINGAIKTIEALKE